MALETAKPLPLKAQKLDSQGAEKMERATVAEDCFKSNPEDGTERAAGCRPWALEPVQPVFARSSVHPASMCPVFAKSQN